MNQRPSGALLVEAPLGRHFVQLHHGPSERLHSNALYVESGLRRGNGIVVIAVEEDHLRLTNRLLKAGVDVQRAVRLKQLTILDSRATLSTFMRGSLPDWSCFRATIEPALMRAKAVGVTRTYADMVSVLWRDGHAKAAVRLEEYWNELSRWHRFSLYCSYTLDERQDARRGDLIRDVGCTHTDIVTTRREVVQAEAWSAGVEQRGRLGISSVDARPGSQSH
jgi:hypothetical protein